MFVPRGPVDYTIFPGQEANVRGLDSYIALAKQKGIHEAVLLKTSQIHTEFWVRMKCQFGCRLYGKSLCCPPSTPTPEETRRLLDSYALAILFHKRWTKGKRDVTSFNEGVVDVEMALFLDGSYKAWSMGAGPCTRCKTCNILGGCAHPLRARPSMEACGIDVFRTAAEAGLSFSVLRNVEEPSSSFGLVVVK